VCGGLLWWSEAYCNELRESSPAQQTMQRKYLTAGRIEQLIISFCPSAGA
jgi:hypothetical protein